jgi:hypothetical protein
MSPARPPPTTATRRTFPLSVVVRFFDAMVCFFP